MTIDEAIETVNTDKWNFNAIIIINNTLREDVIATCRFIKDVPLLLEYAISKIPKAEPTSSKMEQVERDCKNCKHKVWNNTHEYKSCEKWECEFEQKEQSNDTNR